MTLYRNKKLSATVGAQFNIAEVVVMEVVYMPSGTLQAAETLLILDNKDIADIKKINRQWRRRNNFVIRLNIKF